MKKLGQWPLNNKKQIIELIIWIFNGINEPDKRTVKKF